jgi:hypothetical protein
MFKLEIEFRTLIKLEETRVILSKRSWENPVFIETILLSQIAYVVSNMNVPRDSPPDITKQCT